MTIEETLCNIARNNALTFTEEEQDAMAEAILAMQKLKWCREQDLIRREQALRLLLDWAIECGFGLDSFPEEYEKYKHTLTDDMCYTDMVIQIAKCVVEESNNIEN